METQGTAATTLYTTGFETTVQRLYLETPGLRGYEGTLESVIRTHFAQMSTQHHLWKRETFRELLLQMHAKKCYAVLRNPGFIEVLANISAFGNKTIRPIAEWKKDSLVAEGQLASVIRHLFAQYEVPEFMENVFATGTKVQMHWYIQLGRGESVQKLSGFPVVFTGRMAHEFRNTPKHFSIEQAIRRAQAIGYGADVPMAEIIAWSGAVEQLQNQEFRAAVIQFVVKSNAAFDKVNQVLEYLVAMYTANHLYNLKGRTWIALSRQSEEWHIEMAKRKAAEGYCEWQPCAIANFEVQTENAVIRIVQLTSSEALYEEGYEMSHCVAEYDDACAEGTSAIFSVRKFTEGSAGYETLATVEVYLTTYEISEAKARFNQMIGEEAQAVITAWAQREELEQAYEFLTTAQMEERQVQWEAAQQQAAQPARAPQQIDNYARALENRTAYQTGGSAIDTATIIKIVLIAIKFLVLLARMK